MTIAEMSKEELKKLVEEAVHSQLELIGLLVTAAEHRQAVAEDFRFMRRLRISFDGASNIIGRAILMAALAAFFALLGWHYVPK